MHRFQPTAPQVWAALALTICSLLTPPAAAQATPTYASRMAAYMNYYVPGTAQHIPHTPKLVNFVNRYAKAMTGRTCSNFGVDEGPMGGLVLPKSEFTRGTAENLAASLTKDLAESDKRLGNTSKVMLDASKQVVAMWIKSGGKQESFFMVVQIRGERAMMTGCAI